ncbi:MAG: MATE family efflux transporter [Vulcanimicrobiaceae bacterium]
MSDSLIVDHRDVHAAFRRLAVPSAISMLGDQLLGIADTIAIGTLGPVALAGATAANAAFLTLVFAIAGLWSGISIVASQRIGAHDLDGYARSVRAGSALAVLAGCAGALLGWPTAGPLLHAMIGELSSADASAHYFALRCISLIPMALSGSLIAGLGAAGNRKLAIATLGVINLVHIPLLLILALGFGTHHPMGIVGAGISSLISETVAALFAVVYVARRPIYRIFTRLDVDWRLAQRCGALGLPETIFLTLVVGPDVLIVGLLAPLGAVTISAFRALNVVSDLTFLVPSPMQSAIQTVVGQRLGARDLDGAQAFFHRSRRGVLLLSVMTGIVVAVFAWPLAWLITLDPLVATVAAVPLALHMITMPLKGWAMASLAPIRAAGDTRFSAFVGILSSALVIPIVWFGIERLHIGLYSVPIAWIIAWSARLLLTQTKLRAGSWLHRAPLPA